MYISGNYIHHQLNIKSLHFVHTECVNMTPRTGSNYNSEQHQLAGMQRVYCEVWTELFAQCSIQ